MLFAQNKTNIPKKVILKKKIKSCTLIDHEQLLFFKITPLYLVSFPNNLVNSFDSDLSSAT
jgi:hypothetical protein